MRVSRRMGNIYVAIMLLAAFFGMMYLLTSHLVFIQHMTEYEAITLTNISTTVFRFECVLLPLIFILPRNRYVPKIILIKFLLAVLCITCLAGVMWVFNFLSYVKLSDIFDSELMYKYQGYEHHYIAINRFLWGDQTVTGVILSLVLSGMYGILAAVLHKDRLIAATFFSVVGVYRIISPLLIAVFGGNWKMFDFWAEHNLFWIISAVLFICGVWVAARSDEAWLEFVWGEAVHNNDE